MGLRNMLPRRCGSFALVLAFAALASPFTSLRAGGLDLVIEEDFEGGLPANVNIVNAGNGNVHVRDDGSGANQVLSLTQNVGNQGGWAWFADEFDLSSSRVEIEFDLFLGRGNTATPADGAAVIFQFDGDLNAFGNIGGDLGVGNLRGAGGSYEYIAVGFDIWDNGGADREVPCEARSGPNGTNNVIVIQNQASVHNVVPVAVGAPPDFIRSAEVYGSPDPALNDGDETFDPDDLVHVSLIFDSGLLRVKMRGGLRCVAPGAPDAPFEEQVVIDYLTQPFPDRPSNIGFSASTGGANAWQWIDNLVVREGESLVDVVSEGTRANAAINCAGTAVDTAGELDILFEADRFVGGEVRREGDIETGLTITTATFGRLPTGFDFVNTNTRPIDVSNIAGAGEETRRIFVNDAWSTVGVRYQAQVEAGRYEVSLYWSENFAGAVDGFGRGTKLYDVFLNGEKVLCNWSAAAAAGTGSGDPRVACAGVLDTAVARTFTVDADDAGGGVFRLEILIDDLGDGNPPENAALNALSFRRLGAATGQPAGGEVECIGKDPGEDPPGSIIDETFDDVADNACPPGWQCNSNNFTPRVVNGRLRLTQDTTGSTAATAIYEEPVNVCDFRLRAEFDLFMENPDGLEPADGAAFFVMQGTNTAALGGGGGAIGIPGNAYGFAVEFDTWNNGIFFNDRSGFNDAAARFTHVGINNLSIVSTQTNLDFDPDLRPIVFGGTGWPNFFDVDGVHVVIEYDAGEVTVTLEGTTDEGDAFGPQVVCQARVTPVFSSEAVVGFAGGTGGRTQHTDVDNVVVDAAEGSPPRGDPIAQALEDALERWNSSRGELYINCGGPMLFCTAGQFPAPGATGEKSNGETVVWLGDQVGGGALDAAENEFFSVAPLANRDGTNTGLQVAGTNMGSWDARGTDPGVDDNDRIFHSERWADMQYEIPVEDAEYEVTLYFANSFSGTAGTARRFFHVEIEGERRDGFNHCEHSGNAPLGGPIANPLFGFDELYDPVDRAESLYSMDPCNFAPCENNGVTVFDDPDTDRIPATMECGNAAAAALRYNVSVEDGSLTIALTEPDVAAGEPPSPDMNPKISGICVRRGGRPPQLGFLRGDSDGRDGLNLTDGVSIFNWLFLGGAEPPCLAAADTNRQGVVNLTSGVYVLNFLFLGGPAPPPPFPECGPSPDPDTELPCNTPQCEA